MHAHTRAQSLVPKSLKDEAEEVVKWCGYEKNDTNLWNLLKKRKTKKQQQQQQKGKATKNKKEKKKGGGGETVRQPEKGKKTDRTEGVMT